MRRIILNLILILYCQKGFSQEAPFVKVGVNTLGLTNFTFESTAEYSYSNNLRFDGAIGYRNGHNGYVELFFRDIKDFVYNVDDQYFRGFNIRMGPTFQHWISRHRGKDHKYFVFFGAEWQGSPYRFTRLVSIDVHNGEYKETIKRDRFLQAVGFKFGICGKGRYLTFSAAIHAFHLFNLKDRDVVSFRDGYQYSLPGYNVVLSAENIGVTGEVTLGYLIQWTKANKPAKVQSSVMYMPWQPKKSG